MCDYNFFQGKTDLSIEDIEDFEAHASIMQNRDLKREEYKINKTKQIMVYYND